MSNAWLYNHITNIQKNLKKSAVASIFQIKTLRAIY